MNSLFNLDNPVMRFLSKVFDVMYLSVLWGLFSLPIITIGASTTAMYYTTVKVIRRERGYVFQEFWKSFKVNLVQSTLAWILVMIGAALFATNVMFAKNLDSQFGMVLEAVYIVMCAMVLGTGMYIFPVMSRFTMKLFPLIKTCSFLLLKYFPRSLVLAAITAASVFFIYLQPIMSFFVPVCGTLLFSLMMEPILKKYTPHANEGDNRDEWYLE